MIGCRLSRWVYSQHQGHHHLKHYTSAIKSTSGQYLVIGPILKKCLKCFDHQLIEPKAFMYVYVKITAGMNFFLFFALFYSYFFGTVPEEKQDHHMAAH